MSAAFAGVTIAVAVRAASWWPFAAVLAITGFGYLGLSNYWCFAVSGFVVLVGPGGLW